VSSQSEHIVTKYILLSIFITIAVILGVVTQNGFRSSPTSGATASSSDTDSDANYSTSPRIFALGRIEGATREIQLRPQLPGQVGEINVEEGQFVEAGDELLQLDDRQYRYELELAVSELELAKGQLQRLINGARKQEREEAASLYHAKLARLENARLRWTRAENLHQADAIPQRELDNIESEYDILVAEVQAAKSHMETVQAIAREDEVRIAQVRIRAAQARLELARVQLERMTVRASQRGKVLQINVEVGELTGPESTKPTIILSDTSSLKVRAFVEELDAPRVEVGMPAKVTADGLPGVTYTGQVTGLSPRMGYKTLWSDRPDERHDTKTREVMITLAEDHEKLFVGMQVDVFIDAIAAAQPED
jgi:HlyD family secretion protein